MRGHPTGARVPVNLERSPMQRDVLPMPDRPHEGLITYLDGDEVGEGRVEHTVPMAFSGDETTDLGRDSATPVSDDHGYENAFTGRVRWVQIDVDEAAEDVDHLISPEELLRVAMARQ
jgi:arylsulfatase